tara:strand:+ start:25960 stop:26892 length:933 start_codon:yes stop_codon:yes gene_type:complete
MNNKKNGKKLDMKYHCIKCDFHSNDRCDYERHLMTRKHKMDNLDKKLDKMDNKKTGFLCENCGRKYKYQSGLCKHKKKCNQIKKPKIRKKRVIKEKTDNEKEMLKTELKELRFMMKEMIKKQGETNENYYKTLDKAIAKAGDTVNQKMSINIYLNEHCKNAMNLTDFLKELTVSLDDLQYTKEHGYVKGISNIFMRQLKDLKPTERPIHCSDTKRLQFYIKDENKWEKDKSHEKIDESIQDITIKQIKHIREWEKENPNYLKDEKLLIEWHNMVHNAMGDDDDDTRNKNKKFIKQEIGNTIEIQKQLTND